MVLSLPSFGSLFAGAGRSLARFPLPIACALIFSAITLAQTHNFLDLFANAPLKRLMTTLPLAFFATLAATLFGEARFWPAWSGRLLGAAATAILLILAFSGSTRPIWELWAFPWTSFAGVALVLTAMAAPALGGAWDNGRFWDFNRAAWLGAAYAWLAALILAFGLQATAYAMEALLEIDLGHKMSRDFWTLSFNLFWPWLALAGLPRRDEVALTGPPNWLRFLVQWLLVPMVIVYLVVLYAYIVKILIQWRLPEGEVAWVVSSYAATGVVVNLISAPWRNDEAEHIRFFQRWFYPALFAPIAVLALAAWIRIQEYGITEPRYLLVLVTVWLFILALAFSFGLKRLMLAPLSLALLLFAAAFGPWGAAEVSARSQLVRLETTLTEAGLLQNGNLTPAQSRVAFDVSKKISGGIAYLIERGRQKLIAPWFEGLEVDDLDRYTSVTDLMTALDVRYVPDWQSEPNFSYSLPAQESLDVTGFQLLTEMDVWRGTDRTLAGSGGKYQLRYVKEAAKLTIDDGKGHSVSFDFKQLAAALLDQGLSDKVSEADGALLTRDASDGPLRVRLAIENLSGREGTDGLEIISHKVQILIASTIPDR
jgi:hypothetical protein